MEERSDAELLAQVSAVHAAYRAVPEVMAELLRRGHSLDEVAAAAGVHRSTVWRRTRPRRRRNGA